MNKNKNKLERRLNWATFMILPVLSDKLDQECHESMIKQETQTEV
jgi:hypothetical protein